MLKINKKLAIVVMAAASASSLPTIASHVWGNASGAYHWDGPSLPVQLSVIDSSTADWQSELDESIVRWNQSSALNLAITSVDESTTTRSDCPIANGQIRVCNYTYGNTGWSGLASLNIDSNNHILWGTAKVNDSYNMSQADRNKVMCQEIGHLFGLSHTSEDGSSQQTCMDYANDPTYSQWPNAHDYEVLDQIYAHIGGGGGGGGGSNVLSNGVPVTGLSASTGNDVVYTMDVPAGATNISFSISGGTGDADLYTKFGSAPTDSSYDCRPYKNGNNETCTGTQSGGTYYVRVKAYSTFSGVTLTGSYTEGGGGGGVDPINTTINNISVARRAWKRYTLDLPAGYADLVVSISGGTGDADLYVTKGSQSTTTNYDCRPYKYGNNETCSFNNPGADTWYIDIRGYTAASGVTLTVTASPAAASAVKEKVAKSAHKHRRGKRIHRSSHHETWMVKNADGTITLTHVFKPRDAQLVIED